LLQVIRRALTPEEEGAEEREVQLGLQLFHKNIVRTLVSGSRKVEVIYTFPPLSPPLALPCGSHTLDWKGGGGKRESYMVY